MLFYITAHKERLRLLMLGHPSALSELQSGFNYLDEYDGDQDHLPNPEPEDKDLPDLGDVTLNFTDQEAVLANPDDLDYKDDEVVEDDEEVKKVEDDEEVEEVQEPDGHKCKYKGTYFILYIII